MFNKCFIFLIEKLPFSFNSTLFQRFAFSLSHSPSPNFSSATNIASIHSQSHNVVNLYLFSYKSFRYNKSQFYDVLFILKLGNIIQCATVLVIAHSSRSHAYTPAHTTNHHACYTPAPERKMQKAHSQK